MAKTREIKGRMKAIGNIERITKTMQMIATARFQASLKAATDSRAYTQKITELVGELAASCAEPHQAELAHPLLRTPAEAGRQRLLVITSNRGLCGGYNANVLKAAMAFIREHSDTGVDIEAVGKKAMGYFRFARLELAASHADIGDKPTYAQIEQLAENYMEHFVSGAYEGVSVVYMSFHSVSRQTPQVLSLLPLSNPLATADAPPPSVYYEYSPSAQQLLDELLPVTVKTRLFRCFNEAIVSEHISRMVAMKNATDSAGKMGKQLSRSFNRARQAAITTELSEIISGAAALS